MTQVLKVKGKIKNASNRPIITAVGRSPYFLLDARRYEYEEGEKLKSVQAIGTLDDKYLLLNPVSSNEFGAEFSKVGFPHFKFTPKMGMTTISYPTRKKPTTTVVAYKVDLDTWGNTNGNSARIYGVGHKAENKRVLGAVSRGLFLWSGAEPGTGHYFDAATGDWCIGVHYFDGEKSMLVDRFGNLTHITLKKETDDSDDVSVWSSSVASNPQTGGVSYLAVYEDEMTEDDLLSLFYEAKNNFGIL